MSNNSTRKPRHRKPAERPKKPYLEFLLYPHPLGCWSKKIRGTIHHFGRWGRSENGQVVQLEGETWKDALEKYKSEVDDLQAGRTPRVKDDGLTIADLCNRFLTVKHHKRTSGELVLACTRNTRTRPICLSPPSASAGRWTTWWPTTSSDSAPRWQSVGTGSARQRHHAR